MNLRRRKEANSKTNREIDLTGLVLENVFDV